MTYPLATLAPTIDSTGISAPSYEDIYQSLVASFQQIYGSGIYISADSQDGQWLGVLALAIHESNQAAVACFISFSPTYAQGAGLSSLVPINGISRKVATKSTAQGTCVGVAGTVIGAGVVRDVSGNLWDLPLSVLIPVGGSISVTVTAQETGAIVAPAGSIATIGSPQFGWQSFVSTSDASPGAPIETDAQLRTRQTLATALPSLTIREALYSAVASVPGVSRLTIVDNDTEVTDVNGIPAHTVAIVVQGGDSAAIGAAIARTKSLGAQTYGSTSVTVYDMYGLPTVVNYQVLSQPPIYFAITVKALPNYVSTTGAKILQALEAFVNGLAIGEDVYFSQTLAAASLVGQDIGQTFYIQSFFLGFAASPTGTANLSIAYNQAVQCSIPNITLTVV